MSDSNIEYLVSLLKSGVRIAWMFDNEFHEIYYVKEHDNEMKGYFVNGFGKYVDLYNAEPHQIISFESVFNEN
jgi:hypothetical protein